MRIISGKFKGRKLPPPSKLKLRPTTDFAKESLFNLLDNRLNFHQLVFLDLFSGTGSISYELISRGASRGVAVDIALATFKYRSKMIELLDISNLKNEKKDAFRFIGSTAQRFDLIFADPPFDSDRIAELPVKIFSHQLILPGGILVIEHPVEVKLGQIEHYQETRSYGKVNFSFFKNS